MSYHVHAVEHTIAAHQCLPLVEYYTAEIRNEPWLLAHRRMSQI